MAEIGRSNIVLLMDDFTEDSKRLYSTFKMAKSDCNTVVINSDGFLPDDVISVYEYFLGDLSNSDTYLGKPRYFNQIEIPKYWEIEASSSGGTVHNLKKTRAKLFFAETNNNSRKVKVVEWLGENGKVRLSEHYNKHGVLYARTAFNAKGERVNKSYFNGNNQEVICENYVTGTIILDYEGKERIFRDKTEFITFFMIFTGLEKCRLYYNSLSYPFFVSERLTSETKDDILFWQEDRRDDIPGNMRIILDGNSSRTQIIMVQKKEAYDGLIQNGASTEKLRMKGFIYPFERENNHSPNILICTNSDQIEHLEDIAKALPDVRINVAAITTMSDKLMGMDIYKNVALYPGVKNAVLKDLMKECDIYLDINHYDVICDSVYKAFLNNQLILSFNNTRHSVNYIDDSAVYSSDDWEKMVEDIKYLIDNPETMEKRLTVQRQKALSESAKSYSLLI